uniref:Death domain-containing protein n=1 Tax=Amphimedon queenslandica TaxID=400682 RepID=A0A1X7TVZ3_AMPQE
MASQSTGLNAASRTPLGLEHLDIVLKACKGCSADWERLGLTLGLHNDTIKEIERDKNKCTEQMRVMLSEWLKGNYEVSNNYPEPSQHSLCIAVAGIDRSLAETISNDPSFSDINNIQGSNNSRPLYTTQELMQFCTCTQCELETIITTGCPQRREDFHPLNIKRLSQKQRDVYLCHAITEIREVKKEWTRAYIRITQSISRNTEISVSYLKTIITTLDWFGAAKDKSPRLQQLNECQDKESIFEVYAQICSWLNHHPLGEIVHECGTENEKQEYEKYIAKKERFLRHSITFFTDLCSQDLGGAVTEVKLFRFKLDTELSHDVLDGTILPFLQGEVAKLLNISQMNFYILSLREGCLEIVFSIPEITYNKYVPLTLDRSRALENLTNEPVGLKFKSMYYSDVDVHTLSADSDEQGISLTDTNGETKSDNTITDDTLCTPEISDEARKHQLGSNNPKHEDDPLDIKETNLSERISKQNEADIELDHILKSHKRKTATNINETLAFIGIGGVK